jgi:hypothetical protein
MLTSFITRSEVPVFLIMIAFSAVPPILSLPRLTYIGLTDILGVCASEGAGDAKAENTRANILKNTTNDFDFISFTPMVYLPERQGLGISVVLKRPYQAISIPRKRAFLKNLSLKIIPVILIS